MTVKGLRQLNRKGEQRHVGPDEATGPDSRDASLAPRPRGRADAMRSINLDGPFKDALKAGPWHLDDARSSLTLRVPALRGLRLRKVRFGRLTGTLDLSRTPALELTVDLSAAATGLPPRGGRSLLGLERQALIVLTSDAVEVVDELVVIDGLLLIGGRSLSIRAAGSLRDRQVKHELDLEIAAGLDQRSFGETWGLLSKLKAGPTIFIRCTLMRDLTASGGECWQAD